MAESPASPLDPTSDSTRLLYTSSGATFPSTLSSLEISPKTFILSAPYLSGIAVGGVIFHPTHDPPSILLIRRSPQESFAGRWEVPGGGVEDEETILDGVVREVKEETGLTVTKILGLYGCVDFRGSRGRIFKKYSFELEVEEPEGVVLDPKEHDSWQWAREEELGPVAVTTGQQRRVILDAFEKRRK